MPSGITLAYDSGQVGTLNSEKVMVAVPLLYMFMVLLLTFRLITSSRCCDSLRERSRQRKDSTISENDSSSSELPVFLASTSCRVR